MLSYSYPNCARFSLQNLDAIPAVTLWPLKVRDAFGWKKTYNYFPSKENHQKYYLMVYGLFILPL